MTRVLFVLPETAGSADNERVLELHRALGAAGLEARTVALGPGGDGGLDSVVPVLAPAPRSFAAVMELRREQRWCDVLACSGRRVATVAALGGSRGRAPVVVMPREDSPAAPAARPRPRGAMLQHAWLDPDRWCELFEAVASPRRQGTS